MPSVKLLFQRRAAASGCGSGAGSNIGRFSIIANVEGIQNSLVVVPMFFLKLLHRGSQVLLHSH